MSLRFDKDFDPAYGRAVQIAPGVVRVTAANPGPYTFTGTNTYLIGNERLCIIDPGPDDPAHVARLIAAIDARPVHHILITHTHRDHTGAAPALRRRTGARIRAQGPHRPARALLAGEVNPMAAAADYDLVIDGVLADGESVLVDGFSLKAVATPGHTANHLCFALMEEGMLFCGDHVMGWSTSVIAPPDGAMADYLASIRKLQARNESLYLPAHGGPIAKPREFLRGLLAHRAQREEAVSRALDTGCSTIPEIVARVYAGLDGRLLDGARLSVLAHLEDMVARGVAIADGSGGLTNTYTLPGSEPVSPEKRSRLEV